jgi:hypothetical protein
MQHTECVTFKLIYYYHYMFRPLFRPSSDDYNQKFFWVASQFTCMSPYLQCQYIYNILILWHVTPCRNRVSTVPCRREPTRAEESRSEQSCCSATVGYTRYAIGTTIERTFSGGCTIEGYIRGTGMSKQSVFVRSSPTSQLLSRGIGESLEVWRCRVCDNLRK